jgi:O-antigen ligase
MSVRAEPMTAVRTAWASLGRPVQTTGELLALAIPAALLGAGLMAISAIARDAAPLVALAIPIVPLLAVLVLTRPFTGVIVVLATMPFGAIGIPAGFATLQAVEIAVLVVASVTILRRLALSQTPLPWSPLFAFPLALLACTLLALYSAASTTLAVKQVFALIGGWLFASVVVASCRDVADVRRVLGMLVAIASVALSTGGGRIQSLGGGTEIDGRLRGAFDHPNQLGAFMGMAAALAVGLAAGSRTTRGRVAGGVALALLLAALALTFSRGAWIGTATAFLFLLLTMREARRMLIGFAVPMAIIGFVIWSAEPDRPEIKVVGERVGALTQRSPYDGRDQIWAEAIREIREDPLTGQGPGAFPLTATRAASEASSVAPDHAHNILLNWGAETGIPAVLVIVGFAIALGFSTRTAGRKALARGEPRDRAIALAIAAALISVLGQGVFDYVLGNSVLHLTMWALIGCLIVTARDAPRDGYAPVR